MIAGSHGEKRLGNRVRARAKLVLRWVLTGFMVCGHLWENGFGAAFHPDSTLVGVLHKRSFWDMRSSVFIPPGTEQQTFSASRLFAAVYPEAIDIAAILSSPTWRKLAAGDDDQLSYFTQVIGPRIGVDGYQPRDNLDPIAHWIEQDCWRAPSQPPTTFASAPGHRRPGEVPRAFRTVHPIGWTIWKGEIIAPTEEELLTGIQGRSREDGDRDVAPDRPGGEGARYQRRHPG